MNKHTLSGVVLLSIWLIVLWYGFDYFFVEESVFESIKILPREEKTKLFLWLAASVTILAIAIKKIASPFLQKKND